MNDYTLTLTPANIELIPADYLDSDKPPDDGQYKHTCDCGKWTHFSSCGAYFTSAWRCPECKARYILTEDGPLKRLTITKNSNPASKGEN